MAALAISLLPTPASGQSILGADASQAFALVNATRAEKGLPPMVRSLPLDDAALAQSRRMVDRRDIFHNPDLAATLDALGLRWLFTGENVGVGPDVATIHRAFVASRHHYENIVKPEFGHLGIGVVSRPGGGVYVTHVFAQLRSTPSASPTTRPTATAITPTAPPNPAPEPALIVVEGGIVMPTPPF